MIRTRHLTLGLALVVACQGSSDAPAPPGPGAAVDGGAARDATSADAPPVAAADDGDVTATASSTVPAWQAVIDRDLYLERRGQAAVVSGVVAGDATYPPPPAPPPPPPARPGQLPPPDAQPPPPPGPKLVWLADDTEGDGSLAIRVLFAEPPTVGAHLAVAGAWTLDDQRRWYWRATAVSPIAGPAPVLTSTAGHAVDAVDAPGGTRPVTKPKEGGTISFQVLTLPRRPGEGWKVADELGDPIAAILMLPGERPSYGGHDLRQDDEQWVLRRGVSYWVKIGKVRIRKPDEPPVIRATGAPHRIP
jgi:hypothetical protein